MPDMLVKLYALPDERPTLENCRALGVEIRRAMAPDRLRVVQWVKDHSGACAAGECEASFSHTPVSCYLATRGSEIVGYACYDATAPDFFGPTRVLDQEQGKGAGKALLLRCLTAMREEGYGYAIIGSVGPAQFYEKCCGATIIPDSAPGIYKDFLRGIEKEQEKEQKQ
jgi:GNAT superfamily N-acetyltransferase